MSRPTILEFHELNNMSHKLPDFFKSSEFPADAAAKEEELRALEGAPVLTPSQEARKRELTAFVHSVCIFDFCVFALSA